MSYCVIGDVEALGTHDGKAYSATSHPTIAQVNAFIANIAIDMDSRLSTVGVTTPAVLATSPKAFALLKIINAYGGAYLAQSSTYQRGAPDESASANIWKKLYEEYMSTDINAKTGEHEGRYLRNPELLQDAEFTSGRPIKPHGEGLQSRVANLYETDSNLGYDDGNFKVSPMFKVSED